MGFPAVGTVVFIKFPFTNQKMYKKRPALIVAHSKFNSIITCQISSKPLLEAVEIPLLQQDFAVGGLPEDSYVRIDKIQTLDNALFLTQLGELGNNKLNEIMSAIRNLFADV